MGGLRDEPEAPGRLGPWHGLDPGAHVLPPEGEPGAAKQRGVADGPLQGLALAGSAALVHEAL